MGTDTQPVSVEPIASTDAPQVGDFLHEHLNDRLSAELWANSILPTWSTDQPNSGFLLRSAGKVVGVQLAFYSTRRIRDRNVRVCNLAAWCVHEDFRSHGLRLLRAVLRQPGLLFTDLSPSGSVVAVNTRLGFRPLDTSMSAVVNVPWPGSGRHVRFITDPPSVRGILTGVDLEIYRDHANAAAARHLVVTVDGAYCYIIFRRVRRKRLPVFALILYVSDRSLFDRVGPAVFGHLLLRHGMAVTLAERRIVGGRPRRSFAVAGQRRMYRGEDVTDGDVDYLYSELTCVPW
jgi:hypothetical protein